MGTYHCVSLTYVYACGHLILVLAVDCNEFCIITITTGVYLGLLCISSLVAFTCLLSKEQEVLK